MTRKQLPSYSPLSLSSLAQGVYSAWTEPEEARKRLRSRLRARFGCEEVVLFGSGTHALQTALSWAKSKDSDLLPVALPAYTCFDVATAAVGAEVSVVFYDVDPSSLSPDLDSVRGCLDQGAGVVLVSNLFGYPVDWDGIQEMCQGAGAVTIEDAAQGIGASWKGREGGCAGEMTVLSFGRGKGWTGGGGGAVLLRGAQPNQALVELEGPHPGGSSSDLRAFMLSTAQWALGRPSLFGLPNAIPHLKLGETVYREPSPLSSMSAFSAALVNLSEEAATREIAIRKRSAERWTSLLGVGDRTRGFRSVRPLTGGASSYLRYPLLLASTNRTVMENPDLRARGGAPGYPLPLHHLPALAPLWRRTGQSVSGAEELAEHLVTLPTHSLVRDRDIQAIARLLTAGGPSEA